MAEYLLNNYWFWGSAGFMIGSVLAVYNMVKNGCSFPVAVITITAGIYGGIFGTRILYVMLFYPGLFRDNFLLAIAFWQETGSWMGGPFLAPIGMLIVLTLSKQPIWSNLGSAAPAYALAHIIARIGCLVGGCCYGAPTDVPWAIHSNPLQCMVHPTQIYSMIGETFSLILLQWLWTKPDKRIYLYPLYCMILASHRFVSEMFRGTDMGPELIPGLRVFQSVCVIMFVLALCLVLMLKWRKKGGMAALGILVVGTLAVFGARNVIQGTPVEMAKRQGTCLAVTRSLFSPALDEWKRLRSSQGYRVVIQSWNDAPSPHEVKDWILSQSKKPVASILIVGDCGPAEESGKLWHMPSSTGTMPLNDHTISFTSDSFFGDLDKNGMPDVPVGRLAVRSKEDLSKRINTLWAYARQPEKKARHKILVWFGAEGYTGAMSRMATPLSQRLPQWADSIVLGAGGAFAHQSTTFLEQLGNRPLLSLIISHGSYRSIATGHDNQGREIGLTVEDVSRLSSSEPSGPLFLLGCDSGRFAMPLARGDSLAEAFSAHRGGPIAVVGAAGPTHPITNYLYIQALIRQLNAPPETVGQLFIGIQQTLQAYGRMSFQDIADHDPLASDLLRSVPDHERADLAKPGLLQNEITTYNLIGDPSCRFISP